jgi:hypothetical protein
LDAGAPNWWVVDNEACSPKPNRMAITSLTMLVSWTIGTSARREF